MANFNSLIDLTQSPILGAAAHRFARRAQRALQGAGFPFAALSAVWMLVHFVFGRGRDVQLLRDVPLTPQEREDLRECVRGALDSHLNWPGSKRERYKSLTGRFNPVPNEEYVENDAGWFNSLAGVIGAFNIALEVRGNVIVAKCRDRWDFNGEWDFSATEEEQWRHVKQTSSPLCIPTAGMHKWLPYLEKICAVKGIKIFREEGYWWFDEAQLGAALNDYHAFWTRWEFEFSAEELGIDLSHLVLRDGGNVAFLK